MTPTDAPTSTDATLTVIEDASTALATGDFGYADPKSVALAAVRITSLPALGTLKLSGSPVANNAIVAAADIGNLTYLPAANGNGTPYATIGIKVMNASSVWSIADAVMTVNVTPVNDAPTSTGASAILATGTVKTFAAADFPFADADTGDTLSAIKVTMLPAHGTLNLGVTPITSVPGAAIPVANIGNLTYTPATNHSGPDSFMFQVSDGTAFSAYATMAITVNYAISIAVQNGGFENPTPHNPNDGTNADWTAGGWAFVGSPWTTSTGNYGRLSQGPVASPQLGNWMVNLNDAGGWVKQDLGTTVNAGDTLAVTFYVMSDTAPGEITAAFLVGGGPTEYSQTFNNPQNSGIWVPYTLTQTIGVGVSGNLTLRFTQVSGRAWLDNISNVSVTPAPVPGSYAGWATANGAGIQTMEQDHDHDGVPNGIEFLLGGSGDTTGFTPLPGVVNTAGTLSVIWIKAADYLGEYGTDYVVETSTTLAAGSWTPEPGTGGDVTLSGNDVKYTFPSGPVRKFARLKVMGTP